ncbi:DEAD/DEAH box helicase, putative [Ectopseudomonas mendocina]|uniref:DEAD/DEAH box helicase, putative n=1 Tax=Ectopseudomonas mendocina TaxID=300 RepID=A0A379PPM4_ECTME|nr:DEAD/DEAH box helicase [Pseudomonas mendocina]SUE95778.1 DEAD/DEAH box helicase, putative [Pseudomonas mendocina]
MSKIIKIVFNPVVAALVEPDRDAKLLVNDLLSYKIETGPKGMGVAHGSMFDMIKCRFPTGFVRLVTKKLEAAGYRVLVVGKPAPEPAGPENPVVDEFPDDPRYDYQGETMRRLVSLKRMIAQIATGGGKSKTFKLCSERINLPTLFVTTRKSLMYQMAEGYKTVKSGRPIGIIGDGCWNPQPNGVNFAIVDTLVSRLEVCTFEGEMDKAVSKHVEYLENQVQLALKKAKLPTAPGSLRHADKATLELVKNIRSRVELANKFDEKSAAEKIKRKVEKQQAAREETLEFLKSIGFLCLEEAHEVSGNGFFELCNSMPNAHYRLALTATPFMKDSEEANMRLMAATGTIGIKVSEKDLIDRGILAKPFFKIIPSKKPENVIRGTAWQAAYERGIMNNVGRNMQIVAEIAEARRYGLTAIILVQRTKHGEVLNKLLETVGVKVEFIQGENDQAARQAALNRLGRSEIDVLIGTSILDVGVDVPSVGMVILAGGGKAEVAQRQRIGRGLRAKKLGPNVCYIVDFDDLWNNHTAGHSRERRRIIDSTPGFAENIVHYFDFSGHGLKKVA